MAGEFDDFINEDLETLPDSGQPLPEVATRWVVYTAQMKKKPDKDFPYLEIVANPIKDGALSDRRVWCNLTFHPGFVKYVKQFVKATLGGTKLPPIAGDNSFPDLSGKQFIAVPKFENDFQTINPSTFMSA
jgi:hypothetical protein